MRNVAIIICLIFVFAQCGVGTSNPRCSDTYHPDVAGQESENNGILLDNSDYLDNNEEDIVVRQACEGDPNALYQVTFDIADKPYYAEIWLDSRFAGVTPLTIELPGGEYDLEIRQEICYPHKERICIDEHGETLLFTLEEIALVEVAFNSDPDEVKISLDIVCGPDNGYFTPMVKTLWAGTYMMFACKDGYHPKSRLLEITADIEEVFVKLEKIE